VSPFVLLHFPRDSSHILSSFTSQHFARALRTKSERILVLVKRVKERTFQKFVFLNNDITTSQNGGFLILQAEKKEKDRSLLLCLNCTREEEYDERFTQKLYRQKQKSNAVRVNSNLWNRFHEQQHKQQLKQQIVPQKRRRPLRKTEKCRCFR
jgi:hypothetical protein